MEDYNEWADRHLDNIRRICDKIDKSNKSSNPFKRQMPVPRGVVRDWYIKNVVA